MDDKQERIKMKAPRRELLLSRWTALKNERSSYWSHWQEITTYLLPRNGRYFTMDRDRGGKKHNNIYDSTGSQSLRILGAGMMSGATSPARPWFRLGTGDPELNKFHPVKLWLEDVGSRMQTVFQKSNAYRVLHGIYEELGAFGTGASLILPDYESVIHCYPMTIGEYAIAQDYRGKVCTLYREFEKTVSELVDEFGRENCSDRVKNCYDRGNLDAWISVIHAIEPRSDRDASKVDSKNMAWGSYYFEAGGDSEKLLRESGFRDFPCVVPRWATVGGDVYGGSPGMEALGDIKSLQHEQLRKAQVIDYQTNPPLQVPASLSNRQMDSMPGGVVYTDNPQNTIKTLYDVNLRLDYLLEDIRDCRERVRSAFFADIFLMMANSTDTTKTATEIAERHEEKMLMLGPVLERLNNELLEPLIDSTFTRMVTAGMIPPAPEELQGMDLSVEFVSMLAQAQRAIGTNSIDRFVGNLGAVAGFKPEVLDKFDCDVWAEEYADKLGVPPSLIVAGEQVAMIRDARNKAQAAQAQAEMQAQQAQTVKNLAQSPTGPMANSALTDLTNMFSGYTSPSALEM